MLNYLKRLANRRRILKQQENCAHDLTEPVQIVGKWGKTEPHPHPKFAEFLKVQNQPVCNVQVCFKCGKVYPHFAYNQRNVDAELPLKNA